MIPRSINFLKTQRAERKVQREQRKAEIELLKNKEHMNQGEDKEELAKIE